MKLLRSISDLFSNVKLGITLLVTLFVYMTVGSAGIVYPVHPNLFHPDAWRHAMLRQWRPFEMTEFEWFHWWPFTTLLGLIAANIAWTTLRRIPLRPVNFGVWTIHTGILTVIAGSVWYFSTKVEGDAPVSRREVVLEIASSDGAGKGAGRLLASPGNQTRIQAGGEVWSVQVASIDPSWEIRTGSAAGEHAYSIMLAVEGPRQKFIRQVIAGHPELSEDILFTGDAQKPIERAMKAKGVPIIEPLLVARVEYAGQRWFYLKNDLVKSWALYVRRPGDLAWSMRPIEGLPFYNDSISERGQAISTSGDEPVFPIDVAIPAVAADDPFRDTDFFATGYLRYAVERSRLGRGAPNSPLNPALRVRIERSTGASRDFTLSAFDSRGRVSDGDLIRFRFVSSAPELAQRTRDSVIQFTLEGAGEFAVSLTTPPGADGFIPIGPAGRGYALRISAVQDDIVLSGGEVSVAIVDLRTPHGEFRRWIFDDPALNRDMKAGDNPDPKSAPVSMAPELVARYVPGIGHYPITLIAGPDPAQLTVALAIGEKPEIRPLAIGESVAVGEGTAMRVMEYFPRAVEESLPLIVPENQRAKETGERLAMARIGTSNGESKWIRYNDYAFDRPEDVLRRQAFQPARIRLADGREAEVLFSRRRLPLPCPVALETFTLTANLGGFTGETATIRDYTSQLRFGEPDGSWSEPQAVSVNQPVERSGLWFFQAQWDPPDAGEEGVPASAGLNFTVLGVGSRQGVWLQLAGAILAALGMCYAFYVKPVIKRRSLEKSKSAAQSRLHPTTAMTSAMLLLVALFIPGRAQAQPPAPNSASASITVRESGLAPQGSSGNDFAREVDLAPLETLAIMNEGRIKSLGSFAFSYMQDVSGGRRIGGQTPLFTLLDLALRPDAYADADVIRVKNAEVRARIAEALRMADPALADRMRGFQSHGMIARSLLWSDDEQNWIEPVAPTMRQLSGDLIRTAKQVDQLRGAIALLQPEQILPRLRAVPPGAGPGQSPAPELWLPLDDAGGAAGEQWLKLQEAWRLGDASAASRAARDLASAVAAIDPAAYPSTERLWWESWYFRTGQMTWTWFFFFASVAFLLLGATWKWPVARRIGLVIFVVAFALQSAALLLRWYISGRWPNSNMFEAVTTSAWFGSCLALVAEILFRRTAVRGLFALGAAVASMTALMACALLPAQLNPAISNMMPVLHDIWLYIHTNVVIFSYALIFMAAVSAALYLAWRIGGGPPSHARIGGAGEMMMLSADGVPADAMPASRVGEVLDGVTMTLMELSFVMLWSGIAMGAIWADHSWGRPWGWDPKEVFALNTFVVFAVLIHTRWRSKDKGLWTAVLALIGAGVMLFNWIVINFVITGLHSYA
ncbi:MAG: cytochrome c biogenesis protein CcsA [Planctomycetes bacterium]|nr:cytochrome c biogenesis protein CcsA [Planctomycetota bacterium]